MPSIVPAISIIVLLTGGGSGRAEPVPEPPPTSETASETTSETAPASTDAVEDNGWGTSGPAAATAPQPAPAPAPAPTATTPPGPDPAEEERLWRVKQHNRFKGMMISGFSILGGVYGGSLLIGALAIDLAEGADADAERRRQYGRRMMIPLAGPFAAAPVSRSATLGVLTVAAGLGQLLGLSLGIAGAVKLKEFPNPNKRRLSFGVAPTLDGARVGMRLRF